MGYRNFESNKKSLDNSNLFKTPYFQTNDFINVSRVQFIDLFYTYYKILRPAAEQCFSKQSFGKVEAVVRSAYLSDNDLKNKETETHIPNSTNINIPSV